MISGLVSVILPVHNRPGQLREAVASALGQHYPEVEILIVDDGSTDETPEVARDLAAENPAHIRVLTQQNAGPGAAREAGRLQARGEFIQYLDSDDLLLPDKFSMQVAGLIANPECVASYGPTIYRDERGREDFPMRRTGERIPTLFPGMLVERWWATVSPLYRTSALERIGSWLPLRLHEDWEYDCRLAALGAPLHWCEDSIAVMRGHLGARLSRTRRLDPVALADQAVALEHILTSARRGRVPEDSPEFQHFARRLFLLCRNCAAAGLDVAARRLYQFSGEALRDPRSLKRHRIFGRVARGIGWRGAGVVSLGAERFMTSGISTQ